MIDRKNTPIVLPIVAAVVLFGSVIASAAGVAQAALITEEEHWKYAIDRWLWDEDRRRTYGQITPQIIIQNETTDRIEGFIADTNGTRLEMYDGDQIVHVRYLSNTSASSGWQMAGRIHDGYLAIDIPQRYRDAEVIKIFIGTNQYTVNNGSPTTPPTEVFMNSATLNYKTNSTVGLVETEVAQVEQPQVVRSAYAGGSLIDWILAQNGMLPVRSSNPGE